MGKDMIIKLLESQLAASNATISQLRLTIDEMSASMKSMTATIANLEALLKERDCSLEKARNQMRGMSRLAEKKSEKQHPVPEAPKTAGETARKEAERKARGNNGARRRMHFEMETVEHDVYPPGVEGRTPFSTRDTVRYRMIPPRFIKDVYHIHTMKDGERLVSARAPLAPLQNSSFDGSFIAGIAQLRYLYSMPVERIVAYFGENGFDIDKQTAHGLLKKTAALFDNLYGAMRAAVREDSYLNCDETYHKVLVDRELNDGRGSRKGYVWAIAAAHLGLVYFFYDDGSRSEEVILKELEGYSGTIQSDGLAAYKKVAARSGGKIQRLACLQHCKREFLDMKGNPDADRILSLANGIYQNEHRHRIGTDGWTAEDNLKWRREYAPPILSQIKETLLGIKSQPDRYPPKSQMYKAATYMLNQWDGIEAIPSGGDYSWDNNLIERINRYISISRRNSLFFGSHAGAKRGCVFYSLACSCRLHRINFFEYLSDILNRADILQRTASPQVYRNILPDRWKIIKQGLCPCFYFDDTVIRRRLLLKMPSATLLRENHGRRTLFYISTGRGSAGFSLCPSGVIKTKKG